MSAETLSSSREGGSVHETLGGKAGDGKPGVFESWLQTN